MRLGIGHGHIVIDRDDVGFQFQRLPVIFDRLRGPACLDQCSAQVPERLGIIGIKL